MINLKAGFSKDEVKYINEGATEFDVWWFSKAQLMNASHGAGPFDSTVKMLTLIDKGLWQPST